MPTASSTQMRRSIARRATQMAIRSLILFTFLITSSHIRPVPSSRTPATIKSNRVQFTSSVNCIAINGMSNRIAEVSTIMISLLFCIIINVLISLTLLATVCACCGADFGEHSCPRGYERRCENPPLIYAPTPAMKYARCYG